MRAILDADVIAYVATAEAVNHNPIQWDENTVSEDDALTKASEVANSMVEQWRSGARCDDVMLAFSGESHLNFRRDVHPAYKSNRTTDKPQYYAEVVEYLKYMYHWEAHPNLEGDDILGLYATEDDVIVSTDKDILTLPFNLAHVKQHRFIHHKADEDRANYHWMTQTLTGDSVDGFKGAPGIGAKGAERILRGFRSVGAMWDAIVNAYGEQLRKPNQAKKFNTKSAYTEALMNARCARILRPGDYDFDTEEVRLWVPR